MVTGSVPDTLLLSVFGVIFIFGYYIFENFFVMNFFGCRVSASSWVGRQPEREADCSSALSAEVRADLFIRSCHCT